VIYSRSETYYVKKEKLDAKPKPKAKPKAKPKQRRTAKKNSTGDNKTKPSASEGPSVSDKS